MDASAHEAPEADWDIAMAEITAHLLTAYRGIESLPVPAAPREASLSFVAATRFLSAALVSIDEGCIAVWSDDVAGYFSGGRSRISSCQSSRAHDDHAERSVPQLEFLDGETRFDRLAQTNIIGDQQVGPGMLSARTTGSSW